MSRQSNQLDNLVARLQPVRDEDLTAESDSPMAHELFERIVAELDVDAPVSARRGGRPRHRRHRRVGWIALAAALMVAVVLSTAASGVVRDVASFFDGGHDPEAPVPTAPDVVIASGVAGVPWRILATTSDRGLCLGLWLRHPTEGWMGHAGCGYTDIRGDLAPEVRGDPATKCLATPTKLVSCGSLPLHWIGPFGVGGGSSALTRNFAYGPLAADVASVELILTDGQTVRANVVETPEGLDAPLNFYWTAWPCGSSGCADAEGPEIEIAIARDASGRVLERRVPVWNGNPTGDPNGPPRPE